MQRPVFGIKRLLATLAVAALAGVAYLSFAGLRAAPREVDTVTVELGDISSQITVSGNVVSGDAVALVSPTSGRITRVAVAEGDQVAAHRTLIELDARQLQNRIAERASGLRAAGDAQAAAEHDWKVLAQLQSAGGESQQSVDAAKLKWHQAVRETESIASEVARLRLDLEMYGVRAPLTGVVTAVSATAGAWVNQGEVLMKVAGAAAPQVEIRVDAADANLINIGKEVTLSSDSAPGRDWNGAIGWIAPATKKEGTSNTLSARVPLTSAAPRLALGQQIDVKIASVTARKVLVLPSAAIVTSKSATTVATLRGGAVHFVPVTLGASQLKTVEIIRGVAAGQRVIMPAGVALSEHEAVTPIARSADQP